MKKNLIAATVFLFGLGLGGASAFASSKTPEAGPTNITEQMAQCIANCQAGGGAYQTCWNCCVRNICALN